MTEAPDTIVSDRLELRPLVPEDAQDMVSVLADDRLYTFTGGGPPTLTELRARYEGLAVGRSSDGLEGWGNWIIRRRSDGRPVGFVQATIVKGGREASIAWVIGEPWQGQGYATEAAKALVNWLEALGVSSKSGRTSIRPTLHRPRSRRALALLQPTNARMANASGGARNHTATRKRPPPPMSLGKLCSLTSG